MILLLLLAFVIYLTYKIYTDTFGGIFPVLILTPLMTLGGLLMVISFSVFAMTETHRTDHSYDIFSIKRENVVNGGFFLGSGSIDTSRDYIFYYKDTDQFFRLGSVPTRNSRIKECEKTDRFVPHAKYQTIHYSTPFWYAFGIGCNRRENTMTDLYVPVGTIIQDFRLE